MVEKREREKNECCEFQETKSTSINHGNNQGMVTFDCCLLFDDNNNQEHKRRRKKKKYSENKTKLTQGNHIQERMRKQRVQAGA